MGNIGTAGIGHTCCRNDYGGVENSCGVRLIVLLNFSMIKINSPWKGAVSLLGTLRIKSLVVNISIWPGPVRL